MLPAGLSVADVGAGDGRLALALATAGRRVIATERSAGPYEEARRLLGPAGVELRLGDGLTPLGPGEVEVVVLAGLGGRTIARLLERDRGLAGSLRYLVVQPMQQAEELRSALDRLRLVVDAEVSVEQGRHRYVAWRLRPN